MNIYKVLNEMINYIEDNLEEEIDYKKLAKIMAVNVYTMQRVFSIITGITLTEYIKKRRLSMAGFDLYNNHEKVIDVAIKYQYNNSTSFSRAFKRFHGIKPSDIKNKTYTFKNFPKLIFDEKKEIPKAISYEIITLDKLILYGKKIEVNNKTIDKKAPIFFLKMKDKYKEEYGSIKYGMTEYSDIYRENACSYYVLWDKKIDIFDKVIIPKSKWLVFHVKSTDALDIQKCINNFYLSFIPSTKFSLNNLPELEYYHDNKTDILIPII